MHIEDLSDDVLLQECDRADLATAVTKGRERARWTRYRSAILNELCRRRPVPTEVATLSADELANALE